MKVGEIWAAVNSISIDTEKKNLQFEYIISAGQKVKILKLVSIEPLDNRSVWATMIVFEEIGEEFTTWFLEMDYFCRNFKKVYDKNR